LNFEDGLLEAFFKLLRCFALDAYPVRIVVAILFVGEPFAVVVFDVRAVAAGQPGNGVEASQEFGLDSDHGGAALTLCLGLSLKSLLSVA